MENRSTWNMGVAIGGWLVNGYNVLVTLAFLAFNLPDVGRKCGYNTDAGMSVGTVWTILLVLLVPTLPSVYLLKTKTAIGPTLGAAGLAALAWVLTSFAMLIGALSTMCFGSM